MIKAEPEAVSTPEIYQSRHDIPLAEGTHTDLHSQGLSLPDMLYPIGFLPAKDKLQDPE